MRWKDTIIAIVCVLTILGVSGIIALTIYTDYKPPAPPLEVALSKATGASIGRIDGSIRTVNTSDNLHPELLRSLKDSRDFRGTPPAVPADYEIVLHGMKSFPKYQYVSETGELGKGNEWCVASDDFRRLLREYYAKESRKTKGK